MNIKSHSENKKKLEQSEKYYNQQTKIDVIGIKNNRVTLIDLQSIESISSFGHSSSVLTTKNKMYYLNKRIKELKNADCKIKKIYSNISIVFRKNGLKYLFDFWIVFLTIMVSISSYH